MTVRADDLLAQVADHFEQSTLVSQRFFAAHADPIAQTCWAMARRFHRGGRLLACGIGAWATDAQHVSVEFVHPVIVGKRALPALALTNNSAALSGALMAHGTANSFASQVVLLGRPDDIVLGLSPDGYCRDVLGALDAARQRGLLTVGLAGGDGGAMGAADLDHCFVVPSGNPMVIQETHETLYHILWELVHIFLEHEGLLT